MASGTNHHTASSCLLAGVVYILIGAWLLLLHANRIWKPACDPWCMWLPRDATTVTLILQTNTTEECCYGMQRRYENVHVIQGLCDSLVMRLLLIFFWKHKHQQNKQKLLWLYAGKVWRAIPNWRVPWWHLWLDRQDECSRYWARTWRQHHGKKLLLLLLTTATNLLYAACTAEAEASCQMLKHRQMQSAAIGTLVFLIHNLQPKAIDIESPLCGTSICPCNLQRSFRNRLTVYSSRIDMPSRRGFAAPG